MLFSGKKSNTKKELIEQIIIENYNQYYRLAFSYAHSEDDACDIVQNGALKAIRNSYSLREKDYATTWVYRIMLNECFSFHRQPKVVSYEQMLEDSKLEPSYAKDFYSNIDLANAIDNLSDKDKAIIILKYFEEKTLEEIADILQENINTVKSRLYRSIKKLRNLLSDKSLSRVI